MSVGWEGWSRTWEAGPSSTKRPACMTVTRVASWATTSLGRRSRARARVEHEVHHRGQIYIYLGMLGVKTPALYGLTSEEVKARSQSK